MRRNRTRDSRQKEEDGSIARGAEDRRVVEVQEDGDEARGTTRGGGEADEANSVKYPQPGATHWHTVSMQILFTLGVPVPPSARATRSVSLPLARSHPLALSRFTWRAPLLRTPLSPVTSRGKAKRCATHVCTLPPPSSSSLAPRIFTPCLSILSYYTARSPPPIVSLFILVSSSLFCA